MENDMKGKTSSEKKTLFAKILLSRYKAQKATPKERRLVERLQRDILGSKSTASVRKTLRDIEQRQRQFLQEKIGVDISPTNESTHKIKKKYYTWPVYGVVATVLLFVVFNLPIIRKTVLPLENFTAQTLVTDSFTTARNIRSMQLADGTIVHLNVNSKLTLHKDKFTKETREVWLDEGEAYFDVAKDANRPFIVHTADELQTRVLGTSFNIKAYSELEEQVVSVRTGRVQVTSVSGDTVQLSSGRKVNYGKERTLTESAVDGELAAGWINGDIIFDGADSKEIALRLKQYYGLDLKLEGEAVGKIMSFKARFPKETSIVQFARGICSIYGLKYELTKEQLILR